RCAVWTLIAVRLGHRAEVAAEPVEVVRAARAGAPARVEAKADPVHAVLGGEDRERDERVELVAVDPLRVGEAGGELVLPAQAVAARRRGLLGEGLERRRPVARVGGM